VIAELSKAGTSSDRNGHGGIMPLLVVEVQISGSVLLHDHRGNQARGASLVDKLANTSQAQIASPQVDSAHAAHQVPIVR
jgi:hypothetical protein